MRDRVVLMFCRSQSVGNTLLVHIPAVGGSAQPMKLPARSLDTGRAISHAKTTDLIAAPVSSVPAKWKIVESPLRYLNNVCHMHTVNLGGKRMCKFAPFTCSTSHESFVMNREQIASINISGSSLLENVPVRNSLLLVPLSCNF